MRIYIIRHADPDYPNNTITNFGHLEAQALSIRLKTVGIDCIYSSPLGRARDTAGYTARLLGLEPRIESWTTELDWVMRGEGIQDAGAVWDYPGEVFRAGADYPSYENWHRTPPVHKDELAEPFARLGKASDAFLARLGYVREGRRYRCVAPTDDRVAVFCHGGFGLTWLAYLLEIPVSTMWSGFWLPPSSVSMVLMEQQSDEWAVPRCVGLGDTSHLYAAGLPIQPRGIYARNWERPSERE
ncbi:hypothetical protein CCAX7_36680 [Capsulimonas corticalis]|uniref:Uncharacterized protein n=1 Tax=Capsulimonas corticalis TaxID=2219043 RepID=A0A402D1A7_9BACT|nr:histidine phosphatase family protein [Capsulimonas corticalis]BDI31617.1 hypothetical protein CCAX7_36680 [Capsulimonas corticalis]